MLNKTGGSDIEHNKYLGQVSKIMRALTSKDDDLLSHFDKKDESEAEIENSSLHHHLVNNHGVAANKGKIQGQLALEHMLRFCKTFEKITEQLTNHHLPFKTTDLQDITHTALGDKIKIILTSRSYLYQYLFLMLKHR